MSHNDFVLALTLYAKAIPTRVLIMAAFLTADAKDEQRLKKCFPEIWREVEQRSGRGSSGASPGPKKL